MKNILNWFIHTIGFQAAELGILEIEAEALAHSHRDDILRKVTIPSAELDRLAHKFNADPAEVHAAFGKASGAIADALLSLAPKV